MCLYYNPQDEFSYNQSLVANCKNNDLQYIFYNPIENRIYDKNMKFLQQLDLDFRSNIDFISKANPYNFLIDTEFLEDYSKQNQNILNISIDKQIFGENSEIVENSISQKIGRKVKAICKFRLVKKSNFPIPKNSYLLFFQANKNLFCYYNIENNLYCRELNNFSMNLYPILVPPYLSLDLNKDLNIEFFVFHIEEK